MELSGNRSAELIGQQFYVVFVLAGEQRDQHAIVVAESAQTDRSVAVVVGPVLAIMGRIPLRPCWCGSSEVVEHDARPCGLVGRGHDDGPRNRIEVGREGRRVVRREEPHIETVFIGENHRRMLILDRGRGS